MKSFLNYAKNRFLYNLLRLLIIFGLGLIASQFMFIQEVKAEEVTNYRSKYYWCTSTSTSDSCTSTDFRSGSANKVDLFGKEDFPPTYDKWESFGGVYNEINHNLTKGSIYTIKMTVNYTSLSSSEFGTSNLSRYSTFAYSDNGIINYVNTSYAKGSDCFTYSGTQYCNYKVHVTYSFVPNSDLSKFYIGSYNTTGSTFGLWEHYLSSTISVESIDVSLNNDSTIINQNQTIIDQNQSIIDNSDKTNEKLDEAEKTRKGILATIVELPSKIINGILDALKSLFIPEDGFFEEWFDEFMTFVEVKLGFLATPFTIFIDFIESYLNLDASNDVIINIPDISVPNFENHIIVHATSFNWSETLRSKESLNTLWQLYLDFVDVFLILNFIGLCESIYNRVFGGNTANYEYYTVEDSYTYDINTGEVLSARRNERKTNRKKADS